jgi:hypothetical protein
MPFKYYDSMVSKTLKSSGLKRIFWLGVGTTLFEAISLVGISFLIGRCRQWGLFLDSQYILEQVPQNF